MHYCLLLTYHQLAQFNVIDSKGICDGEDRGPCLTTEEHELSTVLYARESALARMRRRRSRSGAGGGGGGVGVCITHGIAGSWRVEVKAHDIASLHVGVSVVWGGTVCMTDVV